MNVNSMTHRNPDDVTLQRKHPNLHNNKIIGYV